MSNVKNQVLNYPIKFTPILKEKVWGGNSLSKLFNKETTSEKIGESWELSAVPNNISVVSNGVLKGEKLTSLIQKYTYNLLGKYVYNKFGDTFPLLFKFIDAAQNLSVQLHPDDLIAKKRHNSFGKTEMWYIIKAKKNAKLVLGFNKLLSKETYLKLIENGEIENVLNYQRVKPGDSFFIAPGTVHAIGEGVLLAEIQQTSDITYRIYDWNRKGLDGQLRTLHIKDSLDVINFDLNNPKIYYKDLINKPVSLVKSPYFITNKLNLTKTLSRDLKTIDSFVVYMCLKGQATIETSTNETLIVAGETVLIPAQLSEISIKTNQATFLEVYIS